MFTYTVYGNRLKISEKGAYHSISFCHRFDMSKMYRPI